MRVAVRGDCVLFWWQLSQTLRVLVFAPDATVSEGFHPRYSGNGDASPQVPGILKMAGAILILWPLEHLLHQVAAPEFPGPGLRASFPNEYK